MKNPLHKKIPFMLDMKIRLRLLALSLQSTKKTFAAFGFGMLLPVMAAYVLVLQTPATDPAPSTADLVASIYEAQAQEIAKSETGIYHVRRIIEEGDGKPAFVRTVLGTQEQAPRRVDEVETWQHNDTALALIDSNGTERSFEAYLSREKDGVLRMEHFGPQDQTLPEARVAFDQAHDLRSLYTAYTSLERPGVPVLPSDAELVEVDPELNQAQFVYRPEDGIEVLAVVDLRTKLVSQELIYVAGQAGDRFEMTRIRYTDRSLLPASEFEAIFNPEAYDYDQIL